LVDGYPEAGHRWVVSGGHFQTHDPGGRFYGRVDGFAAHPLDVNSVYHE
jgi:hypothetical protein